MDIFHVLFYVPIFNLLMFFANNLGSIGWAIIVVAAISKLVTYPLTKGQIEQAKKSKDLQSQIKAVQKQYKFNKEKQTQELAKIQAKALPGQLKGCVSLIIFIVFFFQIRGTIVDLVNRGYHSFNSVAYSESLKKNEDSLKLNLDQTLPKGKNLIEIELEASNGKKLTKIYEFEIVDDLNVRMEEIKTEQLDKSDNMRTEEAKILTDRYNTERASDIAVYNKKLEEGIKSVAYKYFLFFATESVQKILITDDTANFEFYMRPPSGATIIAENTKIRLNGIDVTDKAIVTQGDVFNLDFFGMNLSQVGADFELLNLSVTAPYIILALISAGTQYVVSNLYAATNVAPVSETQTNAQKNEKPKKKGKDDTEEPDMAEAMTESLKITNKLLPIFTFFLSMGYLGGANLLPTGVTLFWTAQNSFVIIQQLIMNRKEVLPKTKIYFQNLSANLTALMLKLNGTK